MFDLADFEIVQTGSIAEAALSRLRRTSLGLSWGAMGGAESARWEETGSPDDLWQWVNRLGRGIEVYDPFGDRVWEGYVHGVRTQIEGRSLSFSLDGMANEVAVQFSFIRYLCPSSGDLLINGSPSGATLVYDDGAGGDPVGEGDLVGLSGGTALYNVTQEEEATISSVDGATNTITLTASVPGSWANNNDLAYGQVMGREMTGWASGADSQGRYGVKEKLVSRAGMTTTTAAAERDSLLDLWQWPLGEHGRGGRGRVNSVTVEALGWWARTGWRLWHWTSRGVLSAQAQVNLIRDEVLDFLDTDESLITDIGHSYTQYREDYNTAQKELIELSELGVASTDGRALVGVERGKRLFLRAARTTDKYTSRPGGRWFNEAGQRVEPWRVRPDGYVVVEDVVPQTVVLAGVADPSRYYLERVEWRWPNEVTPTPLGGRDLETLINQGVQV